MVNIHSKGRGSRLLGTGIWIWLPLFLFYSTIFIGFEILNRERELSGISYIVGFFVLSSAYLLLFKFRISRQSEILGFVFSLLVRILLVFLFPIFEDDWARYLWDGFQTSQGGTPYGVAPEMFFSDPDPIRSEILSRINHPDWPTIYGPILEIYFFIIHQLLPWKLWALKFFLLIPDLGLFYLIRKKLGRSSGMLYFWNPILLKEVFLNGHPDILGIFLLFLSFLLVKKGRIKTGFFVWGFSLATKNFGILLFPFLILYSIKNLTRQGIWSARNFIRSFASGLLFSILAIAISYLPFLIHSKETDIGIVSKFVNGFEFFPLGYSWLKFLFGDSSRYAWIGIVLGSILFFLCFGDFLSFNKDRSSFESYRFRSKFPEGRIGAIFFLFFFFSPVVNAWYLLWMLPFLVRVRRSFLPSWCFLFLGQLAYLNFANLGDCASVLEKGYYSHPQWLLLPVSAFLWLGFLAWVGAKKLGRNSIFPAK
ncbi:hypothetical protein EHO59_11420 [Leptospira semungkisensis]|uniref:DUF2029 domain-containing protein n=1 Tax=Leptospira semungkisensis TaxID=2484985 RepID=A0A4R9FUM7_9LEPT|nr:hypothetical protein [Leptospira semungkisensis]TGK01707.1 hypothetical protein EHO59_11420 [Leptospira semungkisensis]